ncbi:alpha/beta-hydrolase [Thozetella sp. PMI_491]|nr:alpha/beta-hydrolase [Thozetella sp. PMI_491]
MAKAAKTKSELSHHYAVSADGTRLSYYTVGQGPSVLVLHGAVCYALSHAELALELKSHYTVHVASRRERGLSGAYPAALTDANPYPDKSHDIQLGKKRFKATYSDSFAATVLDVELSDLETLLVATKAEYVISISSGAIITLQALLPENLNTLSGASALKAVVIFEPPLFFNDRDSPVDLGLLSRFEAERAAGDDVGAMVTAMQAVQLGPGWIPRWLMKPLSGMMMRGQAKAVVKEKEETGEDKGRCTMGELGKALRYDFAVLQSTIGEAGRFRKIGEREGGDKVKVTLLSGARSPLYLKEAIATLAEVIPAANSVVIEGAGHELLCGPEMRGQPAKAIAAIREAL